MVILTVLFASLLMVTGAAFAVFQGDCECYKIIETSLDNPAITHTEYDEICLDYEDNTGTIADCDISLFPGSITQGLFFCSYPCVGYFKFHGSDNNVITGKDICIGRYTYWGHIVDPSNCK